MWYTTLPLQYETCVLEFSRMVGAYAPKSIVFCANLDYLLVIFNLFPPLPNYSSYGLHKRFDICTNKYLLILFAI